MALRGVAATIERKLSSAFSPVRLEIVDESDRHLGHVGARAEGESHFRIELVSRAFEGRSRLESQRMVYDVLADEMASHVHALALRTLTPAED